MHFSSAARRSAMYCIFMFNFVRVRREQPGSFASLFIFKSTAEMKDIIGSIHGSLS